MAESPGARRDEGSRFSWAAIESSADRRYWKLGWKLVALQQAAIERAVPDIPARRTVGSTYAPLADLEIDGRNTSHLDYLDADPAAYPGCRDVYKPADDDSRQRIPAGTLMTFKAELPDRYYEGLGANVWRAADGHFYATALEGRWGCAAVFTDALIVPADARILSDAASRTDLLAELREITSDFRRRHGLAPEGKTADPRIERIKAEIAALTDAQRVALHTAALALPADVETRQDRLPPDVEAVCSEISLTIAWHRGDGTAPEPPLVKGEHGRPDWRDPYPYRGAGLAASGAIAVALARDELEATRSDAERKRGPLSPRWSAAWLSVFDRLPGEPT